MAANKTNVIWCGPIDGYAKKPLTVEGKALAADIKPGNLVKVAANGIDNTDAASTVNARVLIAREVGPQFGADITTPWDINNNMIAISPRSGENVYVNIAASQTIAIGTGLASNGDGTFKVAGADDAVLLYASEALASVASVQMIKAYKE